MTPSVNSSAVFWMALAVVPCARLQTPRAGTPKGTGSGSAWGPTVSGTRDFEWRDLPTYMLHEHESRAAEFVLDLQAVENFLDRKLVTSRWRFPIWSRSAR